MYKVLLKKLWQPPAAIAKLLLIMRLTTIILITAIMQVSAITFAQKITLHEKNASLDKVFEKIRLQSGYDFLVSSGMLSSARPVSIQVNNVELKTVLEKIFDNQPLAYDIQEKMVVVSKKEPSFLDRLAERWASIDVTGRVVDEKGNPLPGASVKVKGKNKSTTTGRNGDFILKGVEEGATLVISYIGYKVLEVTAEENLGDITLVENIGKLQEVTINKGYYTTTKALNTGNVSTVTANEIGSQPVGDPMAALIGRVPGLSIQQTSGVTGRTFKIRLRGQNSLDNGNDPLFIIDGVQYGSDPLNTSNSTFTAGGQASPFNYLNPEDIESIEVLKDADATAIYGSRGANGVILITTKKAKGGKLELNARYYSGISEAPRRVEFMDTKEYLSMRHQALANDNQRPTTADYDLNGTWDTTRYTDWQKYFIGGTAPTNDANISLSIGNDKTAFRIGAGYRSEGTVYPGDFRSKRAGVNFNINHSGLLDKFRLNFSGSYNFSQNNLPVNNSEQYLALAPNAPAPYNPDGSLNWANSTWANPMAYLEQNALEKANNLISNLSASYNIWRQLTFKTSFGFTATNFKQRNLRPWTLFDPSLASVIQPSAVRSHSIINNDTRTFSIEPQLYYSQMIRNGILDVLLGGTFQGSSGDLLGMSANGFTSDALLKNFAAGTAISSVTRTGKEYKYSAIFARIGYAYKERYVLNLTARSDASSRFGPNKKIGNFGAIGAAWIFTNEGFMKNDSKILSFGKLRLSYGSTGNDQIGEYNYLDTYLTYTLPYQGNTSLIPKQLTNPLYGWERVNKLEIGLELGFLDERVKTNFSAYRNRTKNQLVQVPLPETTGFKSVRANLPAVIQNSGIEFDVRTLNIASQNILWTSVINLTIPRNKLVSFPGIESSTYNTKYIVDQPVNTTAFIYQYTGLDHATGLYTYKDINKDGSLTALQDLVPTFIGQKYFGGFYNSVRIGRLEFDLQIQFVKQTGYGYFFNGTPGTFSSGFGNQPEAEGKIDSQPFTQSGTAIINQQSLFNNSTGSLTDASFVRLKNAGIYYSLPAQKFLKQCKFFLQGQNLMTFTGYKGFDPEAPSQGVIVPPLRTLVAGIQLTL